MSEYSTRFDEAVNQLKDDGIDAEALENLLGWFFLQMASPRSAASISGVICPLSMSARKIASLSESMERSPSP